jgi:uncharacterized protein YbjT (DUF2867 family)
MGPVLVLGATGTQGRAVARALLAKGLPVRGLARSPSSAAKLQAAGVTPVQGDFNDADALAAACQGARAVFSMQNAPFADPQSERREAAVVAEAARRAGVEQIVHTSVSGAGAFHRSMKDWGAGRWSENYWESKADAEDVIRNSGVRFWTILKPAFMMENFVAPKVDFMFPDLARDQLITAFAPSTALALVAAADIGAAAAAAVGSAERFHGHEIELAGDRLTMAEIADVLSKMRGRPVAVRSLSAEAAVAHGLSSGWVSSQVWSNEVGYPATPDDSLRFGLQPTSMRQWAERYVD